MIKKIIKKLIPTKIKNKIKQRELKIIREKIKNTECKYKVYIEDKNKLDGKVAIVTGGSGAIGSAICFKLAVQGAKVIVCGRDEKKLLEVVEQIKNNNGDAEYLILDVTSIDSINSGIDYVLDKYKKIDILVNNAGGSSREKGKILSEQDVDVIDMVLDSNLRGTLLCSKYVLKNMVENNYGKIINIGSTTGIQGNSCNVDYTAAKSGIIGATKAMAKEYGRYNINVNCISPGRVNQIMFDNVLPNISDNGCFLNRIGRTDDVANAVIFLSSDESSFITGHNLVVDGGRSLGLKGD